MPYFFVITVSFILIACLFFAERTMYCRTLLKEFEHLQLKIIARQKLIVSRLGVLLGLQKTPQLSLEYRTVRSCLYQDPYHCRFADFTKQLTKAFSQTINSDYSEQLIDELAGHLEFIDFLQKQLLQQEKAIDRTAQNPLMVPYLIVNNKYIRRLRTFQR